VPEWEGGAVVRRLDDYLVIVVAVSSVLIAAAMVTIALVWPSARLPMLIGFCGGIIGSVIGGR
jgi:hypothetical protein